MQGGASGVLARPRGGTGTPGCGGDTVPAVSPAGRTQRDAPTSRRCLEQGGTPKTPTPSRGGVMVRGGGGWVVPKRSPVGAGDRCGVLGMSPMGAGEEFGVLSCFWGVSDLSLSPRAAAAPGSPRERGDPPPTPFRPPELVWGPGAPQSAAGPGQLPEG